jgi:hypothetical protein
MIVEYRYFPCSRDIKRGQFVKPNDKGRFVECNEEEAFGTATEDADERMCVTVQMFRDLVMRNEI